jgi:hypothetical protein
MRTCLWGLMLAITIAGTSVAAAASQSQDEQDIRARQSGIDDELI